MVINPAVSGAITDTYTRDEQVARVTSIVLRSITLDGVNGTFPGHVGIRVRFNNGQGAQVPSLRTSDRNWYSFVIPVDSQDFAKWFDTNPPGIRFSCPISGWTSFTMEAVTFNPTGAETALCATGPAVGNVQAVFEMTFEQ